MQKGIKSNWGATIQIPKVTHPDSGPLGWGIYADEPVCTFINANQFVKSTWQILNDSDFDALYYDNLYEDVAPRVEKINNNCYWIWGSMNSGGLCFFKTSPSTFGYKLFYGLGTKTVDGQKYYRWFFEWMYVFETLANWQVAQTCILEQMDGTFCIVCPAINDGGVGKCRQVAYDAIYGIYPYDHIITSAGYEVSTVYFRLDQILVSNAGFVVQPQFPSTENDWWCPRVTFYGSDIVNSTFWSPVIDTTGYDFDGSWYGNKLVDLDPNEQSGDTTSEGGYGVPNNYSDDCGDVPDSQFSNDAFKTGFLTAFMPSDSELKDLNEWLYSSITDNMATSLKRIVANPLDYIISLGMIHYTPTVNTSKQITFGGFGTGVMAPPIASQYYRMDCGYIDVEESWHSFLDYSDYTRYKIYLPYIGVKELSADDCTASRLKLEYLIDNATGNCIARLKCTRGRRCKGDTENLNSWIYRFTGNCFTQIPVSSVDWRNFINGTMSLASGIGTVATGNFAGIGAIANGVMSMKPNILKGGSLHSNYGYMDTHYPYLIIEKPIQAKPADFNTYRGYTSNITKRLGMCEGFTKVSPSTMWTNNIRCTDDEMEEIKTLLMEGVKI